LSARKLIYTVTENDGQITVKEILKTRLNISRREISHAKHFENGILCDGKHTKVTDVVGPGQQIEFNIHEKNDDAAEIVPVKGNLDIIYEDEDIIVINKPAGVVVHPVHGHFEDSLSNYIAYYFKQKGEEHVMRAIGRLDRETSGVILFCKNRHSAAILSGGKADNIGRQKTYYAIVHGQMEKAEDIIDAPIGEVPGRPLIRAVREDGQRAVTRYEVVHQYDNYALVKLQLETGRTHQIRVHMSSIGHPLVGDTLYDVNNNKYGMHRCALHAGHLNIQHPITGKEMVFEAQMPQDMYKLVRGEKSERRKNKC